MVQERRKYSRIAFHAPATLTFPDRTCEAVVLDLSLKGALVRLPAGTTAADQALCKLRVRLDETLAEIAMDARVVHVEGRYAGLRAVTLDLDSITHLRRLVELNLGDPALLDRELSALIVN
ncbi:PilZ domain-containing protein [Propionivibrio sp.]|uniref:PilZ domain-containing protein n=1 Tax=Propionivibrio sp. TaxID=2212460 RepID=UPI0039E3A9BA